MNNYKKDYIARLKQVERAKRKLEEKEQKMEKIISIILKTISICGLVTLAYIMLDDLINFYEYTSAVAKAR